MTPRWRRWLQAGTRRADVIGIGLIAATATTWALGEGGVAALGSVGTVLLVLVLALGKGLAIALDYMGLREAPKAWRRFVVGWLLVVVAWIAVLALLPTG